MRHLRSRFSVAIFALTAGVTLAVLGSVYWATTAVLDREADEAIRGELAALADRWNEGGLPELVRQVERRSVEKSAEGFAYLVADEKRIRVAGNIRDWPASHGVGDHTDNARVEIKQADVWLLRHIRLQSVPLENDHALLVGRDLSQQQSLVDALEAAGLFGMVTAVILAIAAGLVGGRNLIGRVEIMRESIAEILSGARDERVPVGSQGDEFDELALQFNRLLDENDQLLSQVREATNNIAHDLRTPLQRMRSRLESALTSTDPPNHELLAALSAETDRLLDTFNGLLQIARVEADEIRRNMQPIGVVALIDDIQDLYVPLAEEVGLRIEIDVAPDLYVLAERQLLGQAIANLVDNAIKYAPLGGVITISARSEDQHVRISVADHGPGIPEEDRERVVDRLVRLDAARTVPGSGLGLSFVAAVARLHGPPLELHDNDPGLCVDLLVQAAPRTDRRK